MALTVTKNKKAEYHVVHNPVDTKIEEETVELPEAQERWILYLRMVDTSHTFYFYDENLVVRMWQDLSIRVGEGDGNLTFDDNEIFAVRHVVSVRLIKQHRFYSDENWSAVEKI